MKDHISHAEVTLHDSTVDAIEFTDGPTAAFIALLRDQHAWVIDGFVRFAGAGTVEIGGATTQEFADLIALMAGGAS